jgi:Flagellar hook-length control protein FliK
VDAINLPTNIALPTSFGAPAVPLQPGQVVQALVLELLQSGAFRLQLPQAVLDVRSDVPLTPGGTVTLAVQGSGTSLKLDILAQTNAPPAPAQTQGGAAPAPPDAAVAAALRRPIGEAVIVARASLPETSSLPEVSAKPAAAPIAAGPPDVTPSRALAEAVRVAAARQGGLGPLFADAEQAAQIATLPAPVRAAVTRLLGLRVPLDENLSAADVKQALSRSGVLLEPRLAAAIKSAVGAPAAPAAPSSPVAAPAGDLKTVLLVLRQALKTWAGQAAPPAEPAAAFAKPEVLPTLSAAAAPPLSPEEAESVAKSVSALLMKAAAPPPAANALPPLAPEGSEILAKDAGALLAKTSAPAPAANASMAKPAAPLAPTNASAGPPPPYRGAPLAPQPPAPAAILDNSSPRATAERLIAETDAALSRQTLLQAASLPDAASLDAPRDTGPRWTFEVPFATGQGTAILPFEIARDGRGASVEPQSAAWRARFSLDLEPMGPVHALVTLSGDRASVTLWAERHATAAQLNDNAPMLGDALRAAELQPSELAFRVGAPRAAKPAAPGRFMDRAS